MNLFHASAGTLLFALISGYSRSPEVEIVGSYFPGWMISLVLGVAVTAMVHVWLRHRGLLHSVGHPALIYPAMVLLFTCLFWLAIFA